MKILAIDTATEACSAALRIDGKVTQRYTVEPRAHARLILPMVDELLAEAEVKLGELDALAFGRGPGAFTGLRIAAAVAQGLVVSSDLPVVPISNLAALAWAEFRMHGHSHCLTAIDARMAEIYWAAWQCTEQGVENIVGETVTAAEQALFPAGDDHWVGVGTGWGVAEAALRSGSVVLKSVNPDALPSAVHIAELAELELMGRPASDFPPEQALPIYLRNDVAKKPKKPV